MFWSTALKSWWVLFKEDVASIASHESPSEEAWLSMRSLCERFEGLIDAYEREGLSGDDPQAPLARDLQQIRRYLDEVSNGPITQTELAASLYNRYLKVR